MGAAPRLIFSLGLLIFLHLSPKGGYFLAQRAPCFDLLPPVLTRSAVLRAATCSQPWALPGLGKVLALMLHLPGMLESQIPCRLLASHGSFPNRPTSLQPFTTKASKTGALEALAIAADDFSVCF